MNFYRHAKEALNDAHLASIQFKWIATCAVAGGVAFVFLLTGCKKSSEGAASTPKEAAAQVQQVFKEAPPEIKKQADTASEALRTDNYEQAIVSLDTMQRSKDMTVEQRIAVHNSMVLMETKLIMAMEAGDERAKKAFEVLRQLHRN